MSLQTELKLPWPEISLQAPPVTSSEPEEKTVHALQTPVYEDHWGVLRSAFQGKYSRFANYLMYLSTDFSGGFKVCSVLEQNPLQNTFSAPFSPPGPPILPATLESVWTLTRNKVWEELDRDDWELLGFGFLLLRDIDKFREWVEVTKSEFEISPDCHNFLFLLGWEFSTTSNGDPILRSLACYASGDFEKCNFQLISSSVLKDGLWQLSGVLLDSIEKTIWSGDEIFPFLEFISGFFGNWQTWEKVKFLNLTLGKIPAFTALRRAQRLLPKETFLEYYKQVSNLMRGNFEDPADDSGYELSIPFDPFMDTLIRFNEEGEKYAIELEDLLKSAPYSYIYNLQVAILKYRQKDYDGFLKNYELGGRMRYMPIPLYLFARVNSFKENVAIADSIFSSLKKRNMTPIFPHELGDL